MVLKVCIGTKSGKCYQKELSLDESESFYGKVLGEEVDGTIMGLSGATLQLTGGSDKSGFPMRRDLPGTGKKRLLLTKSTGFKGKLRGKRFGGLRYKKTVAGNTISEVTHQLNVKVIKGDAAVEKAFAPAEEPAAEEKSE